MPKIVNHELRRSQLSELAYSVITQQGYDAATFRTLASEAGCTTGAIVHYFPTRDDILLGALRHAETLTRDRMDYCLHNYPGIDALRQCLFSVMPADKQLGANWRLWISFIGRATSNELIRDAQTTAYTEARSRWADYIRKAQSAGDISTALDARMEAKSVMALLDGLGVQSMIGRGALNRKQQQQMIENFLAGLMARKT